VKVEYLGKDASGNVKYPDVGFILKDEITRYCESKGMHPIIK